MKKETFILIIDDVIDNIKVLGKNLKDQGYIIEFALNARDALNWIEEKNFDLILLDVMMPEIDGFQLCSLIKEDERNKEIPIIFLTAKTDIESIAKGFKVGGVDYITKPFQPVELLARVKTHLTIGQQKRELKELDATKNKFFSIIAHDLRGPLYGILQLSKAINEDTCITAEEKDAFIEHIQNGAKHTYSLLENLLIWARQQTKQLQYNFYTVRINDLIQNSINPLLNSASQKNISIEVQIENNDCIVSVDVNILSTVIRNLVSNAIKFTNRNGKIQIIVKKELDKKVKVLIKDNGIGMDENELKQLIQIDKMYTNIGTESERGTGLGLILCKDFLYSHKSTLSIESEVGRGSTFSFVLQESA